MVTAARVPATAALAALLGLAGCSGDFGGRCAEPDDCSSDRICVQGYCLPPDSSDAPDGGLTPDGGPVLDGVDFGASCRFDEVEVVPAYDPQYRPCADAHTAALWRFDNDFEATTPPGVPEPMAGAPNDARVRLESGAGISNGGAVFDGQGDPDLAFDAPVRAETPLTIELWIRVNRLDTQSRVLLGNLRRGGNPMQRGGFELFVDRDDAAIEDYTLGFAWWGGARVDAVNTAATFPPETWVHLAAVVEADGTLRLYIDGEPQVFPPVDIDGRANGLVFGSQSDPRERFYGGVIDEVRISTVARDPALLRQVALGFARPGAPSEMPADADVEADAGP